MLEKKWSTAQNLIQEAIIRFIYKSLFTFWTITKQATFFENWLFSFSFKTIKLLKTNKKSSEQSPLLIYSLILFIGKDILGHFSLSFTFISLSFFLFILFFFLLFKLTTSDITSHSKIINNQQNQEIIATFLPPFSLRLIYFNYVSWNLTKKYA